MTSATSDAPAGRFRPHTREATLDDLPAIIRVYLLAYAQPPWNEQNDPAATENYLRWLMAQPRTHFLVATLPLPAAGVPDPLSQPAEAAAVPASDETRQRKRTKQSHQLKQTRHYQPTRLTNQFREIR